MRETIEVTHGWQTIAGGISWTFGNEAVRNTSTASLHGLP